VELRGGTWKDRKKKSQSKPRGYKEEKRAEGNSIGGKGGESSGRLLKHHKKKKVLGKKGKKRKGVRDRECSWELMSSKKIHKEKSQGSAGAPFLLQHDEEGEIAENKRRRSLLEHVGGKSGEGGTGEEKNPKKETSMTRWNGKRNPGRTERGKKELLK